MIPAMIASKISDTAISTLCSIDPPERKAIATAKKIIPNASSKATTPVAASYAIGLSYYCLYYWWLNYLCIIAAYGKVDNRHCIGRVKPRNSAENKVPVST
jgi:hypothetical protein